MVNKKLLVLGIGPSQVDLIKIAKEMQMIVYACAHNDKGKGKFLVDEFRQIDIKDTEAIKAYVIEKEVDFILSMGLEMAIPTITKVSEDLKLPSFVNLDSLMKLENKAQWRETLGDIEGNVKFKTGKSIKDFKDWDIYPAILKPIDGSGQRGVYKVNNYEDVEDVFIKSITHSRSKELIIEDFVDGPEISVNSFMYNGKLEFVIVSDRISYKDYPGGIIKEHYIPSRITNDIMEEKIKSLVETVNNKMGFKNGHIYFQLKIEDNEPKLIEFTPRYDGCHMWRLIYISTGLDLRKVSLEILDSGRSPTLENYKFSLKSGDFVLRFISDKPNTIVNKENYNIPDDTLYLEWYYENGDKVKSVTGYMEKLGYMVIAQ